MRKSLILFALFWSTILFAQQSDWKIYTEIDGVKIETRNIECYGNEILTFRISNANNYSVSIMWNEEVWVDGEMILKDGEVVNISKDEVVKQSKKQALKLVDAAGL